MKNKLGLFSIILLGINTIIGTGIFLLPSKAVATAGPLAIISTLFTSLIVISLAFCFADMAGRYEKSGGPYIYAKESFGDFIGFEVGFIKLVVEVVAWSAIITGFTDVIVSTHTFENVILVKFIIITVLMLFLFIVNILGIDSSKKLNNIITITKLLPLLLFILVAIGYFKLNNFLPFVAPKDTTHIKAVGSGAILIFYAFSGFESIAFATEDMHLPKKNLPKAIILIMTFVSIFYLIIIGLSISILGPKLTSSINPIADAMYILLGNFGYNIIVIGTIISIFGICVAESILVPRISSSLTDQNILPKGLSKLNKYKAPYKSIIITYIITYLISIWGIMNSSFETLVAMTVIANFIQYIPTALSVIVQKSKGNKSHFNMPFGYLFPVFSVIACLWLVTKTRYIDMIAALIGLILGAIIYYIRKKEIKNDKANSI